MPRRWVIMVLVFIIGNLTVLSTATSATSGTGSIAGKVVNKQTGVPLPLVNIILRGTTLGSSADKEGHYIISEVPIGRYLVIASMIGYKAVIKTIEVAADKVSVLNFELSPTVIPMGEIIITATRTEHIISDIPVSAHVVTREEMNLANIETAAQAVRYLTGVDAQRSFGWARESVKLQGLDPQYALVLLDGQKLRGGAKRSVDLSQYPAEMIERVEIIKGPASSLYGSDAVSGVINIISRAVPEKPIGSASVSLGTYNTRTYRISHGTNISRFGYLLSYTRRESDGMDPKFDKFKDEGFQASLGYEIAPIFKLSLKPGYFRREQTIDPLEQERYTLNSLLEWHLCAFSTLNLRASWFRHHRFWLRGGDRDIETDVYNNLYEAELKYTRLVKNRHLLTLGYHYLKEEHKHFRFDASKTINSFFIQNEIDLHPLGILLGTRIDHHDRWGVEINPAVGLLYRLTDDFRIRGSVGRAFRAPPLCFMYTKTHLRKNLWVRANPDLEPEKSIGSQLGIEYNIGENLLTRLSFFRNDIKDMIERYDTGERKLGDDFMPYPVYSFKNIARVHTQGLKLMVSNQFSDWLSGRLGYTWLDTKDEETGKDLLYNPVHKVNMELGLKIPRYRTNINLRGEYIGERLGFHIEPGLCPGRAPEPVIEELDPYFLAHIKVNKSIVKNATFSLSVNNIFDKKYYEWALAEKPGREFLVGIGLSF